MVVAYYKARCLVCLKSFEVPRLSEISHGEYLFYDRIERKFYLFNWSKETEIKNVIGEYISSDADIQLLNDNTKGNTTLKIVAIIADGDKECVFGLYRCPRCKYRFNIVHNTKIGVRDLEKVSFSSFSKMTKREQFRVLTNWTKNGL